MTRPSIALVKRTWRSPMLMTWGASAVRSLNLLLVLPLVVTRLSPAEIALWYLFTTLTQLQLLADMGFSPTFVRVFAYGMGGAGVDELKDRRSLQRSAMVAPNWQTVELIWGTVRTVYSRLTFGAVLGLVALGTPIIFRPALNTPDPTSSFAAWGVIVLASTVILRGNAYSAYLNGLDQVALVRRWEAIMVALASGTQALVLIADGGLFALVVAHQSWMVLNVGRNWYLARNVEDGRLRGFRASRDRQVMDAVWPSAWRSGLGMLMGTLPLQATGLFYAQVGTAQRSAEYLLSLNVLTSIRGFSMAPFYSRLPLMARYRATGEVRALESVARRGMALSYWTFTLLALGFAAIGDPLLVMIGAEATLVGPFLWSLLSLGLLIERYGAMHLQLYSTTNHILWHIANGVTAVAMLFVVLALFPMVEIFAFPAGLILAYGLFYVPYVVSKSWKLLSGTGLSFDALPFVPPFLLLTGYVAWAVWVL